MTPYFKVVSVTPSVQIDMVYICHSFKCTRCGMTYIHVIHIVNCPLVKTTTR